MVARGNGYTRVSPFWSTGSGVSDAVVRFAAVADLDRQRGGWSVFVVDVEVQLRSAGRVGTAGAEPDQHADAEDFQHVHVAGVVAFPAVVAVVDPHHAIAD